MGLPEASPHAEQARAGLTLVRLTPSLRHCGVFAVFAAAARACAANGGALAGAVAAAVSGHPR